MLWQEAEEIMELVARRAPGSVGVVRAAMAKLWPEADAFADPPAGSNANGPAK